VSGIPVDEDIPEGAGRRRPLPPRPRSTTTGRDDARSRQETPELKVESPAIRSSVMERRACRTIGARTSRRSPVGIALAVQFVGNMRSIATLATIVALSIILAGPVRAGSSFKVGSFTKSTSTGTPVSQSVAHGLGVTPKALILWTGGCTGESFAASYLFGFGVTDGTTSRSVGASSQDNVNTTNGSKRLAEKAITIIEWGEMLLAEADFSSWDSTSFTLSWTTNNTTAYVIHFIAIGGTDLSSKVVGWTLLPSSS